MSYSYKEQRAELFTDQGQRMLLRIRDRVHELLEKAGAVRVEEAISGTGGDSWVQLACIDRLVELKEIVEVTDRTKVAGQYRVFVKV